MAAKKDDIDFYDIVPFVKPHISTGKEGDISVITFPRFRKAFFQKHFVLRGKSKDIHVRLDKNGTFIWDLIDGRRSVRELINLSVDHFQGEENYELRVIEFIRILYVQGFILYMHNGKSL